MNGLGIAPLIVAAIIGAASSGASAVAAGVQAGRSRRAIEQQQRLAMVEAERDRKQKQLYLIAGAVGIFFLAMALQK